jgi:hypothetical protein
MIMIRRVLMEQRLMEAVDELRVATDALDRGIKAILDGDLEEGRGYLVTARELVNEAQLALVDCFWSLDSAPEGGRKPQIQTRKPLRVVYPLPGPQLALKWGRERLSLTG